MPRPVQLEEMHPYVVTSVACCHGNTLLAVKRECSSCREQWARHGGQSTARLSSAHQSCRLAHGLAVRRGGGRPGSAAHALITGPRGIVTCDLASHFYPSGAFLAPAAAAAAHVLCSWGREMGRPRQGAESPKSWETLSFSPAIHSEAGGTRGGLWFTTTGSTEWAPLLTACCDCYTPRPAVTAPAPASQPQDAGRTEPGRSEALVASASSGLARVRLTGSCQP